MIGQKIIETRTWKTDYRGPLLIVSSRKPDTNYFPSWPSYVPTPTDLPLGRAIAIVDLVDCRPMKIEDEKEAMIPYSSKKYSWIFKNIRKIKSFSVKGKLRLYSVQIPKKGGDTE